jgi:hypothetical protein
LEPTISNSFTRKFGPGKSILGQPQAGHPNHAAKTT